VGITAVKRHPLNRADIDLNALLADLRTRLGQPVEMLTSPPTDDEPGVLILEDPKTGEHLDVDPAVVAAAVAASPRARKSNERQFLDDFDAAPNVAGQLRAMRNYIARRAADDEESRRIFEKMASERARQVRNES
jgi:hypothetical protein